MNRVLLVAAALAANTSAAAAPVLVEFVGDVTRVGSDAPSNFYVGEAVSGAFVYYSEVRGYLRVVPSTPSSDSGHTPGSFDYSSGWVYFHVHHTTDHVHYIPSGPFGLASASGFIAIDQHSELSWNAGSVYDEFPDDGDIDSVQLSARELFTADVTGNWFDPVSAPTLQTISGPVATAMSVYFEPTAINEDFIDAEGFYPISALAPADSFPGLRSGVIGFDPLDSASDGFGDTSVGFRVTSYRVTQIPEPHGGVLLLLALASVGLKPHRHR